MYNSPLDLSGMSSMTEAEQDIGSGLRLILSTLKKQKKLLKMAKATKVNPFHNKEWNFIVKHVVYFLESVMAASPVFIDWDITSNAYLHCDQLKAEKWRNNLILISQDGLELGVGEIKPEEAAAGMIEMDRIKVMETMKKQLKMRLKCARSARELQTFGIVICNNTTELSRMQMADDGRYVYPFLKKLKLGTTEESCLEYDLTLEVFLSFIGLIEESPVREELNLALIFNDYSKFIKPTVYVLKSSDDC
ncbi:hypothetical protein MUCCIDRAFT_110969 [Mucor lusitanicus CBS 277.49]|uniref:Uncharacterized protein n=2 Tax=Mucor circinelloides f. lusitanicus TaxID=29924 RepID=A0A162QM25_MUCCL|nr:hypothetical protein MUCCIDRAFT_110969 [Mucor lusitanicus CBS 277.49]